MTAEGTQTSAQVARLRALGCTDVQGYYFARPMDGAALGALLEARLPAKLIPPELPI